MSEALDRELERQERRLGPEIFKPLNVRTLADLKRVLTELDPNTTASNEVVGTQMTGVDVEGKTTQFSVRATTQGQSKRDILLSAFESIKRRLEVSGRLNEETEPVIVSGKPMRRVTVANLNSYTWIDPLLERWFGATRDGLFICWHIGDDIYKYDVFKHKLFKASK